MILKPLHGGVVNIRARRLFMLGTTRASDGLYVLRVESSGPALWLTGFRMMLLVYILEARTPDQLQHTNCSVA